jgi:hypothetical protein
MRLSFVQANDARPTSINLRRYPRPLNPAHPTNVQGKPGSAYKGRA